MGWIVRVELPTIDTELASSLLWDLNTTGIATVDPDRGGGHARSGTADPGQRTELVAGFETGDEAAMAIEALVAARSRHWPDDRRWLATIEPIDAGDWVDPERRAQIQVADVPLTLEIGAAFGDGGHPSTQLVLDLMQDLFTGPETGSAAGDDGLGSVLDFGCGTGILSLAALAGGANAVVAVDNDPVALEVTERNLVRNRHLVDRDLIELCDHLEGGRMGGRRFDLILANVLLPVQQQWGPTLSDVRAEGGKVLVSGVLESQRPEAMAAYPRLTVRQERRSGPWLALVLA